MSDILKIKEEYLKKLKENKSLDDINQIKSELFGKNGKITNEFKKISNISSDERKKFASELNSVKDEIQTLIDKNSDSFECYLANDNSKGQVILSGKKSNLEKFANLLKEKKIKNINLPVSAPFHCKLMRNATFKMENIIKQQKLNFPKIKVVSNVTATEYNDTEEIKKLLIKQIESPVRWRESIEYMISQGTTVFIEIGPGKVLSGLIKRINKDVKVLNIDKLEDIEQIDL